MVLIKKQRGGYQYSKSRKSTWNMKTKKGKSSRSKASRSKASRSKASRSKASRSKASRSISKSNYKRKLRVKRGGRTTRRR